MYREIVPYKIVTLITDFKWSNDTTQKNPELGLKSLCHLAWSSEWNTILEEYKIFDIEWHEGNKVK